MICDTCGVSKPDSDFYYRKDRSNHHKNCKQCVLNRQYDLNSSTKDKCIEYKGGQCSACGYKKYSGSLDFHHLDKHTKEMNIAYLMRKSWDKIQPELDKCILLCSNCHREEHARQNGRIP
jgi:5-methylcytosine-specific restriction endonuclease McrA